ncbi:hypothetical protein CBF23_010935 [Marinomonas agarivorans]|nr:hypothetical protein CBF23_010935 [Marinomonas agarivorans]
MMPSVIDLLSRSHASKPLQSLEAQLSDSLIAQRTPFQANMEVGGADSEDDKYYVYVVGKMHVYFPDLSIEKEFYQACLLSGVDVSLLEGVNDEVSLAQLNSNASLSALLYKGLSKPENGYVAREMSWTFNNVDNNEIYALEPLSDDKLLQFVAALGASDQEIIMVGQWTENDRVLVSNLIPTKSSNLNKMIAAEKTNESNFKDLVDEILSLNANDGFQPDERGLNYLLYNNKEIYNESFSLCYKANPNGPNPSGYQLVNVEPVTYWSGKRLIAKIIFHYQGINTGARQSWYSAADVTGEYPFLLTKWKRFLPQR